MNLLWAVMWLDSSCEQNKKEYRVRQRLLKSASLAKALSVKKKKLESTVNKVRKILLQVFIPNTLRFKKLNAILCHNISPVNSVTRQLLLVVYIHF